ncbi:hypothetical protein Ssi03_41870 [Sphaerisporangium siamense]|nr:hypothetical protein Ssi03_41870 [Sphaerisporangium siamense]
MVSGVEVVRWGGSETIPQLAGLKGAQVFGVRRFPTPADYHAVVEASARRGNMPRGRAAAEAQRDWHVRGQTGCQFARLVARDADSVRWDYIVADASPSEGCSGGWAKVSNAVQDAIADRSCQIVSVLLPDVRTGAAAVDAIRGLVAVGPWWLEVDEVTAGHLRLHLRFPIGGGVQAWVMAFAPLDFLPATRRGPYFELAVRVKPKPEWIFHRLTPDREVAHLADVPLQMSDERWEHRWASTLRRTRMILGREPDEVSAARSTLTVPEGVLAG